MSSSPYVAASKAAPSVVPIPYERSKTFRHAPPITSHKVWIDEPFRGMHARTDASREGLPEDAKLPFDYVVLFDVTDDEDGREYTSSDLAAAFAKVNEGDDATAAPPIKHKPAREFFTRFPQCEQGQEKVTLRQFEIARSFVVIGLLAEQCGLETYCYWSCDRDQIICKLRAEPKELMIMADKQDYLLQMKPQLDAQCPVPAHLEYDRDASLDYLWQRYVVRLANGDFAFSRFRAVDRLKLIDSHIDDFIGMRRLESIGFIAAYFPLHDHDERQRRGIVEGGRSTLTGALIQWRAGCPVL